MHPKLRLLSARIFSSKRCTRLGCSTRLDAPLQDVNTSSQMSIAVVRCGSLLKLEWDACTPLSELRSLDACLGHSWTRACLSREMRAPGACKFRMRYARLSFVS